MSAGGPAIGSGAETHTGVVRDFDAARGLGVLVDDAGSEFPFHCTEIADGSRDIAVGTHVTFVVEPGLGRWEAGHLQPR